MCKYTPETRSMEHIFSCETREELEKHLQNYGLAEDDAEKYLKIMLDEGCNTPYGN